MKKILFTCVIFLFLSTILLSQTAPDTLWTRQFGNIYDDVGYDVIQTSDGNLAMTGFKATSSIGSGSQIWLLKTDQAGEMIFEQTFGGYSGDYGRSIVETNDGGYAIAGYYYSLENDPSQAFLLKTNSQGDSLWTHFYGSTGHDCAYDAITTNDNGFMLVGFKDMLTSNSYDVYIIKTDSLGNIQWENTYGLSGEDKGYSITETTDSNYIITGKYYNNLYIMKIDPNGNVIWDKTYDSTGNDCGHCIIETYDNNFVVIGTNGFLESLWLLKTDSLGDTLWTKTFDYYSYEGHSVFETVDNGYVITGMKPFGSATGDVGIIKTDKEGNQLWEKTLGSYEYDNGSSIIQIDTGEIIVVGYTDYYFQGDLNEDLYLIKLNKEIKANFSANPIIGYYPSLEVNFTNESLGNPTNWQWDFENDGTYDVKLKVSNSTLIDSLIKYDYITVEYCPPIAPKTVEVNVDYPDVDISWTEVDTTECGSSICTDGYIVLNSQNISSEFNFINFTPDTTYVHTYVSQYQEKMFYQIIAIKNYSREQIEYLENLNNSRKKVKWSVVKQNLEEMK